MLRFTHGGGSACASLRRTLPWAGMVLPPLGRKTAAHENLPLTPLPGVYGAAALGRKSAALREGEVGSRSVSRRARGGGPFPV